MDNSSDAIDLRNLLFRQPEKKIHDSNLVVRVKDDRISIDLI
jgi:hypothetical protein